MVTSVDFSVVHVNEQLFLPELHYVMVFALANPSVVCNIRVTYSADCNFWQCFYAVLSLSICWPRCRILRRSTQGNPFVRG